MSPAAERGGDLVHVDITLRAQADLHPPAAELAQEAGDLHTANRARIVHELLGFDEALGHDAPRQRQPCDATIIADLHTPQGLAEPSKRVRSTPLVERRGYDVGLGARGREGRS